MDNEFTPSSWCIEGIQLVNWGPIDGYRSIPLLHMTENSAGIQGLIMPVAMIGENGAGKTSIADAICHAIQDPRVRYNGAATGASGGRTTYQYVLGKTNDERDANGSGTHAITMRPNDQSPVWSCVAVTFYDLNYGSRFTALVLDWVGIGDHEKTTPLYAIVPGRPNPLDIQAAGLGTHAFRAGEVKALWEDAETFPSCKAYLDQLYSKRLGSGPDAKKLFMKVLEGEKFDNVTQLYTDFALDHPDDIYQDAARFLDDVSEARAEIDGAQLIEARVALLNGLPDQYELWCSNASRLERYKALLGDDAPDSKTPPFWVWGNQVYKDKTDASIRQLTENIEANEKILRSLDIEIANAHAEDDLLRKQLDEKGAGALPALRSELDAKRLQLERAVDNRAKHRDLLERVGAAENGDEETWVHLQEALKQQIPQYRADLDDSQQREQAAKADIAALTDSRTTVKERIESLTVGGTGITTDMARSRLALANAMGCQPTRLPYVAELVDMRTGMDGWRQAVNDALYAALDTILIDASLASAFLKVRTKLGDAFDGRHGYRIVDSKTATYDGEAREGRISSVVRYDKSNALWRCAADFIMDQDVNLMEQLPPDPQVRGVSIGGVTASGKGGRGGHAIGNGLGGCLMGFHSDAALREANDDLIRIEETLTKKQNAVSREQSLQKSLSSKIRDAELFDTLDFHVCDTSGARSKVDQLQKAIDDLEQSDAIKTLQSRRVECSQLIRTLENKKEDKRNQTRGDQDRRAYCEGLRDNADTALRRAHMEGVTLREADRLELDKALTERAEDQGITEETWTTKKDATSKKTQLEQAVAFCRNMFAKKRDDLASSGVSMARTGCWAILDSYAKSARDNDAPEVPATAAGLTPSLVEKYLTILEELRRKDVSAKWWPAAQHLKSAAVDLGTIHNRVKDYKATVTSQLYPINNILKKHAVMADGSVLSFECRDVSSNSATTDFRRTSREVAQYATRFDDEGFKPSLAELDGIAKQFEQLAKVVQGIVRDHAEKVTKGCVDPRSGIVIEGTRTTPDGKRLAADDIDSASGGEGEELYAAIIGSVCLYSQSGASGVRPHFATLVIDEAFKNATSDTTTRALHVLLALGFHVILLGPTERAAYMEDICNPIIVVDRGTDGITRTYEWKH